MGTVVSNQIDHEADSFGKKLPVFDRTMLSSHDDEDRCVNDAMFDEFARSAIVPNHASLLFDCDNENSFQSNSSMDYDSIADNIKMVRANVLVPLK